MFAISKVCVEKQVDCALSSLELEIRVVVDGVSKNT